MRLIKEDGGNIAVSFALVLLPLMMLAGFAIEFGRHQAHERQASAALDSTVLAVARERQLNGGTQASLTQFAQNFFNANNPPVNGAQFQPLKLSLAQNEVILQVEGIMPSGLLSLVGADHMDIFAEAGAVASERSQMELILALDVSGSMAGDPIVALRKAANILVDQVIKPGNNDIRIGIVPFNNYVNVGLANRDAAWIDVPDNTSTIVEVCPVNEAASIDAGCTFERVCEELDVENASCRTQITCPAGVELVRDACFERTNELVWLGCVGSRERPLNTQDRNFGSDPAVGVLMDPDAECFEENQVLELTSSASVIRKAIEQLRPAGRTYMAPGMAWSLRALSSENPFTTARLSNTRNDQVVVLLTDGANTRSFDEQDGNHESTDIDEAIDDMLAACEEVKAASIEVYTINFAIDDKDTEALLAACATSEDHVFEADSPIQLQTAFRTIANRFSSLALSR